MKHCMMIPSVLGKLLLEEEDGKIVRLLFERDIPANVEQSDTPTLRKAAQELSEYFAGNRKGVLTFHSIPKEPIFRNQCGMRCVPSLMEKP